MHTTDPELLRTLVLLLRALAVSAAVVSALSMAYGCSAGTVLLAPAGLIAAVLASMAWRHQWPTAKVLLATIGLCAAVAALTIGLFAG